jgi:CelD/BcsL family acetyltransferase involved in cellulose biosynthesis
LGDHVQQGWILSARREGCQVGLAVVFDAPIRRRLLPIGRAAFVHETGIDAFDALCIEYNGFLVDSRHAPIVQQAMFHHICRSGSPWREVHLRRADVGIGETVLRSSHGVYCLAETRNSCLVDLVKVRERNGDYLGLLSGNRREQIRRSMRAYAAIGPLDLTEAHDVPTALEFLDRLIALHDRHWVERGGTSDFTTPYGRAFHKGLVASKLLSGEVQLLRVCVGAQELGYVYSFIHQGRVCFYQSGYDYQMLGPKHRPGLVTLVLAIQHNAAKGMSVFDFLAGNQAYKASLATDRAEMISWTLQRRSALSTAEMAMRWKLRLARRLWAHLCAMAARRGMRAVAGVLCLGAMAAAGAAIVDAEIFDFLFGPTVGTNPTT